jgi:hypothetical protein
VTQVLFRRQLSTKSWPTLIARSRQKMLLLPWPQMRKWGKLSFISFGITVMAADQGQLVLATGLGLGSMGLVYWLLTGNWQQYRAQVRAFFRKPSGQLTLAVGAGSLVTLSTYLVTSLWRVTGNPWLAIILLGEGFGILLILGLLGNYVLDQPASQVTPWEDALQGLTAPEPLKRLLAVRQLIRYGQTLSLHREEHQEIRLYFQYLLAEEQDANIRQMVLDYLQQETKDLVTPSPLTISVLPLHPKPLRRSPLRQANSLLPDEVKSRLEN